jgi:nuclear transport factor 2 (NTF2) superfamily protein
MTREARLAELYRAFNARDVDAVLAAMALDVRWPNAWEGGWLQGHDEIRDYWRRQWDEIDPTVEPVGFETRSDGRVAVRVHQVVKTLEGAPLAEGDVLHVYRFDGEDVVEMVVEEPALG